jgi:hypothetical protein
VSTNYKPAAFSFLPSFSGCHQRGAYGWMILFLSPLEILVNAMHMVARCALFLQQVENVLRIAVNALPP